MYSKLLVHNWKYTFIHLLWAFFFFCNFLKNGSNDFFLRLWHFLKMLFRKRKRWDIKYYYMFLNLSKFKLDWNYYYLKEKCVEKSTLTILSSIIFYSLMTINFIPIEIRSMRLETLVNYRLEQYRSSQLYILAFPLEC